MIRSISGNEAVALAAVNAGATVITGYPGTPSSEAIASLWDKSISGVEVQWSVNEKVAFEIAAAAAWAGQRSLCTMKMSGLNVCYDSLISVVYSGCKGALVVYVCDDPGVSAGMPEQDVRGFARMSDMPVIDCTNVADSYTLTQYAFSLSEQIGSPVMLRSVTSVSLSHETLDVPELQPQPPHEPQLEKNIAKYTKAGAKICMDQHRDLIFRLKKAESIIRSDGINEFSPNSAAKLGIVSVGIAGRYLDEGIAIASRLYPIGELSRLWVKTTVPAPVDELCRLAKDCDTIIVIEENEPYIEHALFIEAQKLGSKLRILGKEDGSLSRIGSFDALTVARVLLLAVHPKAVDVLPAHTDAANCAAARPIGVCAGCPHRGTFLSINTALKQLGFNPDNAVVTGDIGCTILGMSPPFYTLWTEISMGASVPFAQGFSYAGIKTPLIATIGDSTFLHGGIPGFINAVWNNTNLTAIILDNGWTGMTGMQVNPGTANEFQRGSFCNRVDIAKIVPALGVPHFAICDPYDVPEMTRVLTEMLAKDGVKVILARRECAIQAGRRKIKYGTVRIDAGKCTRCKVCIRKTGCPALLFDGNNVTIDAKQCNGCGICASQCRFSAIVKEA
ncbi:MAG: indolepyruvate ferredoxin oxidoreductase subunit alpha [Clostridia bacterium]